VEWWKKIITLLVHGNYLAKNAFSRYTVIGVGSKNIKNVSVINLQLPATNQCSASKQYLDIRKRLSVFNKVSPYMIINDKVLADISTANPQTVADLLMVDGVSNAFINKYGDFFIGVVEKKRSSSGTSSTTKDMSYTMYQSGKSINNIVSSRGLKRMTIESHITDKMGENLKDIDRKRVGINDEVLKRISNAVKKVGKARLRPIKDIVDLDGGKKLSYFQIKIALILKY